LNFEGCEEDARRYTKMKVGSEPGDDGEGSREGRRKGVHGWRTNLIS
jgi:hypothetical protein